MVGLESPAIHDVAIVNEHIVGIEVVFGTERVAGFPAVHRTGWKPVMKHECRLRIPLEPAQNLTFFGRSNEPVVCLVENAKAVFTTSTLCLELVHDELVHGVAVKIFGIDDSAHITSYTFTV
jgi:hypothetical protein